MYIYIYICVHTHNIYIYIYIHIRGSLSSSQVGRHAFAFSPAEADDIDPKQTPLQIVGSFATQLARLPRRRLQTVVARQCTQQTNSQPLLNS